ncbi:hypothetical protein HSBGL_0918 [Halapricum desulfuricans]|uniref:Uncharacterized protein n=1 Tax=Halapricum desulfuricans TaxID=2841257 RepID=A0A897NFK7_9EURY|nr:hypothetical protein HSBGL_0918 [Halapricum desulfuricans]
MSQYRFPGQPDHRFRFGVGLWVQPRSLSRCRDNCLHRLLFTPPTGLTVSHGPVTPT